MLDYHTITNRQQEILYSGHFDSFSACVEAAITNSIPLTEADFRAKNLQNITLDDAIIFNADFTNANLTGANLSEATLTGCNWHGATLYNTCFAYAKINNCIFDHAHFGGTIIAGADLSGSRFSGLSCLDLNFIEAESLHNCLYISPNNRAKRFSVPPIVIKGYGEPIIITE